MSRDSDAVDKYYSDITDFRLNRILKIRRAFLKSDKGVRETFKYKMPTFEKDGNWVALANQKNYISVYFCSEDLISNIKRKYPELNTGKGCVRFIDKNNIPLEELKKSFNRAMKLKK